LSLVLKFDDFRCAPALKPKFMYKESCVFVCEDFPKENQKLANKQLTLVWLKLAIFLYGVPVAQPNF